MMKIQSMLNPTDSAPYLSRESTPVQSPASSCRAFSPPRSTPKPDKVQKDGFVNTTGNPKGAVRYTPFEVRRDPEIGPVLDKYHVVPDQNMGRFKDYPRYIPYTSSKKDFQNKTGRKGFDVFQYEFIVRDRGNPSKTKKHLVLWDYQVGLVRITPFFKALNYSKTTPNKVLQLNEGLDGLTVSITGGSLAAQGYWMPFDCAKAVMATFCYDIRHLLTPMFGKDFMEICLLPTDNAFGTFKIDPAIVRACTEDMRTWRTLYAHDAPRSAPGSPQSPSDAYTPTSAPSTPLLHKSLRPRATKRKHNPFSGETESGYGTDPDRDFASSSTYTSPQVSPKTVFVKSEWTSINRVDRAKRVDSPMTGLLVDPTPPVPSPKKIDRTKRAIDIEEFMGETEGSDDDLRRLPPARLIRSAAKKEKSSKLRAKEWQAANILLGMATTDQCLTSPSQTSAASPSVTMDATPATEVCDPMEWTAVELPVRAKNLKDESTRSNKRTAAEALLSHEPFRKRSFRRSSL
ncbi:hypothetical protein NA57DRAFT_75212 [Rhizodiscina lignyota]|uniref:HTH APSES-type domain-containing protein n=1 Tax=Rhizodiscina lignyota TaxID=1504668 RepID=A0A9P4IGR2_9PEZI|nr:hypothetical protein NA57DRAFT_75212 [Rhizodiscina lignyota]